MWQLLSLKSRRITMKLCAAGLVLRSFWEHVRSTLFSSWASLQCFQLNKIPSIEPLPNFYWQFCQWWKDKNFGFFEVNEWRGSGWSPNCVLPWKCIKWQNPENVGEAWKPHLTCFHAPMSPLAHMPPEDALSKCLGNYWVFSAFWSLRK